LVTFASIAPVATDKNVASGTLVIMGWDPNRTATGTDDIVSANPNVPPSIPAVVSGSPDVTFTGWRAGTFYDRRWRPDPNDYLAQSRDRKQCEC